MVPLLVESAVVLIPGAITTAALFPPGHLCLPGRLALTFVAGFSAVAFVAWALALLSVLTLASLVSGLGILSVALAVVAWRRSSPRYRLRYFRNRFRLNAWEHVTGLIVMIAAAWIRLGSSSLHSLPSSTTLRFWADGMEIVTAGEIPDRTLQWGEGIQPAASKVLFNCFTAAMDLVGGSDALSSIAGPTWLAAVFMVPALWWLGRSLGLGLTAPILALVLAANQLILTKEMTTDLLQYRAESFGRIVAFSALALAIAGIQTSSGWREFAVVALLFSVAALTHLVPTVVAVGVLFWYAAYQLLRGRLSRQTGVRLAGGLAIAVLVVPAVWLSTGATLGFRGVTGSATIVGSGDRVDPTLLFGTRRVASLEEIRSREWYSPPSDLVRRLVGDTVGDQVSNGWLWLGVTAAAAILLIVASPERLQPVAVAALGLGVNIVAATLLFARYYDSFAMAHFGPRRLSDYMPLLVWLLLLLIVELVLIRVAKVELRIPSVLILGPAITLMVFLLTDLHNSQRISPDVMGQVEVVNWVRDNTPCEARILSNTRTSGTFQVLTGRVGVNEGMGPFFKPLLLRRVNGLLIEMNEFFQSPTRRSAFLAEQGVDFVVLFREIGTPSELGQAPGLPSAMADASFLDLVYSGSLANIYRVDGVESTHDFPQPSDFPGYICRQGSLAL